MFCCVSVYSGARNGSHRIIQSQCERNFTLSLFFSLTLVQSLTISKVGLIKLAYNLLLYK